MTSVNKNEDFITISVSGVRYQLQTGVIHQFPGALLDTLISSLDQNGKQKYPSNLVVFNEKKFIFVQRSPQMFEFIVLQTYITGKLHVPKWMCAESVLDELKFWRLDIESACKCCSDEPNSDDASDTSSNTDTVEFNELVSSWERFRRTAWDFCDRPSTSIAATAFSIVSLAFVLLACGVLVADSVPNKEICVNNSIAAVMNSSDTLDALNSSWNILNGSSSHINLTIKNIIDDPNDDDSDLTTVFMGVFSLCYVTRILQILEMTCVAWFSFELLLRVIVCPKLVTFLKNPLNIIDILSTIPYYIEIALAYLEFNYPHLQRAHEIFLIIRILRCLRVFRILKLARYFEELRILGKTLKSAKDELCMLILFVFIAIFIFSSVMYQLEKDEPDTPFSSIPASCWWGIVTLTTVGYGDMYPKTIGGKILAATACVTGIIITAFPVSILVEHFTLAYKNKSQPMFLIRRLKSAVLKDPNIEDSKTPAKITARKIGANHHSL